MTTVAQLYKNRAPKLADHPDKTFTIIYGDRKNQSVKQNPTYRGALHLK